MLQRFRARCYRSRGHPVRRARRAATSATLRARQSPLTSMMCLPKRQRRICSLSLARCRMLSCKTRRVRHQRSTIHSADGAERQPSWATNRRMRRPHRKGYLVEVTRICAGYSSPLCRNAPKSRACRRCRIFRIQRSRRVRRRVGERMLSASLSTRSALMPLILMLRAMCISTMRDCWLAWRRWRR